MKRILSVALLALFSVSTISFAETVSAPTINAKATVGNAFTLVVDLKRDTTGFPDITNDALMDFGTLVVGVGGTLVASEGIMAFIYANSHSLPYTITSNVATTLTNGPKTIPAGAFVINNAYSSADNVINGVSLPNEGTITTTKVSAVGNRTIYTSGGTHSQRVVQAHYTITDDPVLGATSYVPVDQAGGTYSTSVIISATR